MTNIGKSRGRTWHASPNGPDSFVLTYKFYEVDAPHLREILVPPLTKNLDKISETGHLRVGRPLQEILDPPLNITFCPH